MITVVCELFFRPIEIIAILEQRLRSSAEAGKVPLVMETIDLEYFRGTLTQSLNELLRKGNEAVSHLLESAEDSSDFIDQATREADRSFRLRMQDRENKLIRKIEKSLMRIDDGTFGICEMCGEDISVKRLRARPVTTYCITCKNRMETLEKVAGT